MEVLNNDLFKQVVTIEDNTLFDYEWKKICEEKGANFYPLHINSTRFFILDIGKIVGTVEFTKRNPAVFSICESYFDFTSHPLVLKNQLEVMEVGKISIFKEYRSGGHVDKILKLLCLYAEVHDVKQYIAYMNLELYRLLVIVYGLRLERLGEEIKATSHTAVPVMCDIEKSVVHLIKKNRVDLSMFIRKDKMNFSVVKEQKSI